MDPHDGQLAGDGHGAQYGAECYMLPLHEPALLTRPHSSSHAEGACQKTPFSNGGMDLDGHGTAPANGQQFPLDARQHGSLELLEFMYSAPRSTELSPAAVALWSSCEVPDESNASSGLTIQQLMTAVVEDPAAMAVPHIADSTSSAASTHGAQRHPSCLSMHLSHQPSGNPCPHLPRKQAGQSHALPHSNQPRCTPSSSSSGTARNSRPHYLPPAVFARPWSAAGPASPCAYSGPATAPSRLSQASSFPSSSSPPLPRHLVRAESQPVPPRLSSMGASFNGCQPAGSTHLWHMQRAVRLSQSVRGRKSRSIKEAPPLPAIREKSTTCMHCERPGCGQGASTCPGHLLQGHVGLSCPREHVAGCTVHHCRSQPLPLVIGAHSLSASRLSGVHSLTTDDLTGRQAGEDGWQGKASGTSLAAGTNKDALTVLSADNNLLAAHHSAASNSGASARSVSAGGRGSNSNASRSAMCRGSTMTTSYFGSRTSTRTSNMVAALLSAPGHPARPPSPQKHRQASKQQAAGGQVHQGYLSLDRRQSLSGLKHLINGDGNGDSGCHSAPGAAAGACASDCVVVTQPSVTPFSSFTFKKLLCGFCAAASVKMGGGEGEGVDTN